MYIYVYIHIYVYWVNSTTDFCLFLFFSRQAGGSCDNSFGLPSCISNGGFSGVPVCTYNDMLTPTG